jgi:hypothetical protein
MLVTLKMNTTHRSICNKGSSTLIAKYQVRRRRGRISAAVQSICWSSSRGCIGNSTRPISYDIGRMAQPPLRRCMSCNNVRVLAFSGLHVTLCCTYWGVGRILPYTLIAPSSDRSSSRFVVCKCRRNFHMVCHCPGLHGCVWLS